METELASAEASTEAPPVSKESSPNKVQSPANATQVSNGGESNTTTPITPAALKDSPKPNSRKPKKRKQKLRDVTAPRQPLTGKKKLINSVLNPIMNK